MWAQAVPKEGTVWLETVAIALKKLLSARKDAVAELHSLAVELRVTAKENSILAGARAVPEMEWNRELGLPQPAITSASAIQPEEP